MNVEVVLTMAAGMAVIVGLVVDIVGILPNGYIQASLLPQVPIWITSLALVPKRKAPLA